MIKRYGILFIAVALLMMPVAALAQSLTMHETFGSTNQCWSATNKTLDEVWDDNGGCYSYSYCVVNDPCGGSNKVFRVRVIIGDHNGVCPPPWDDPSGSSGCTGSSPYYPYKHRSEIIEHGNQGGDTRPDMNQNFWLGWRMYIPSNYPNPANFDMIVSQIIDVAGGADGTDWALWVTRSGGFLDEQRTTAENGSSPNGHVTKNFGSSVRGKWHNFVLHQRRGTSTGRHRIWYNGVLQQDYSGRTTATTQPDAWWKFGEYKGCVSTSFSGLTYDMYFDDFKVAYGTSDSQDLRSLVSPTAAAGVCGSTPDPDPDPEPDPGLPPIGSPITAESCTVSQQSGTNGLIIVPDDQANLETAVETNTSKTILVKQGNYSVNNFQIGASNVVKPYNCQAAQVIMNTTTDNIITADNWVIAGMRFFCRGLNRDCFQMDDANSWIMRNNEIKEIMRGGPHITRNSTSGTLDGNLFESCPTCVQGNMVTVGDIRDPGGVGCTGTPCLFGNSPSNITIKNNTFSSSISPGNTGGGGNHMLAIDGYNRLGLEIHDNVFKNPHNFWSAISFTNNWLRPGNALNGSANVHHNTIYGPFTGAAASSGPNGPAIYLQDAVGCKAANDCPNHRIHHNYIRNSYTTDTSSDGRKLSGAFKGHSSRYTTATIEHNIDDNNNNAEDRETEAVHGLIFRQNTFFVSAFRFQNEICTDTHTADNLVFDKNAFYGTRIVDLCTGSPDWLITNNVISAAGSTFVPEHLDSGNTPTIVAFGNVGTNTEDFTITTAAESQKGALPVPTITSSAIGDDCSLNITVAPFNANGHNHGPISIFDKAKLTVKYNGSAQTVSSGNIAGNVLKAQMASCPAAGATVTFDATYGWCQDSANVGGVEKHMNARCLAVTGSAVTNNVTGGAPPAPATFYIDAACPTSGNGTTATCGANGPWNSFKAALETSACAGMVPGSILEVKGETTLDLTCEGAGTHCYSEDNVQVAQACSGITIQNAVGEHVIVDGSKDIKGSTWISVGNGVFRCTTSGCSGDIGDVFAHRAWYDRGIGEEELDLIQSNQVCDTTMATGTMRVSPANQNICARLSNGSTNPAATSYFRVPWYTPFLNGVPGNATNITIRKNPASIAAFHIQRYRNNAIEIDAPSNPGWRIEGLRIHDVMNYCIMASGSDGNAALKILNNTLSFCGQEAIRLVGDTGSFEISGNTITDIQTTPYFELCSGVGTDCLSGASDHAKGIRVTNNTGVGGLVSGNTLLRIGGGFNGRARGINLNERTNNVTVRNNYIAHMSGLPLFGSGITVTGSSAPGQNNNNLIYNNRVYDTDICFYWLYTATYASQAGTTNYLLNNTCAEPTVSGLRAAWEGSAFLDGSVIVENNIFSARNAVPTLLAEVPATQASGWTTLNNNVFECDNCGLVSPCEDEGGCDDIKAVISWGSSIFGAAEACEAGVNCVTDISSLGSGFSQNTYGDINVNLTGGTEPDLHIASPSIAIDAGKSLTQVATDYAGTTRPRGSAFDAGAFESAGATTFALTQKSFRFYAGRSEDGINPLAAVNGNVELFESSAFSLRFAVVGTGGDAPPIDLAIWARKCTPSCGSWTLLNAESDAAVGVYILDNPVRANGELISNGLTLGSNVFDAMSKAIDALPNAIGSAIVNNRQFEAEFHLGVSSGVAQGNTVEMRIEQVGGGDLDAYTVTPVITIGSARERHKGLSWR